MKPEIISLWGFMRKCDVWGLAMLLKHIDDDKAKVKEWATGEARDEKVPPDGIELYASGSLLMAEHFS